MTTVGQAFDALGYGLDTDETVAIVTVRDGMVTSRPLEDVRDEPIGPNTYYSTGAFPRGTTFRRKGDRAAGNVRRILAFPYDFDLKDFLGVEKTDLFELEDDELEAYIAPMRTAVEDVFARIGLPIHRLDYTGYGLSAHVAIPRHKAEHVAELKRLHAATVRKINSMFGGTFADPQVSDAGSRIMRLVPCENIGVSPDGVIAPARQSRTLATSGRRVTEAMLRGAAEAIAWQGQPASIPVAGEGMSVDEVAAVIEAMVPYHQLGQKHFVALGLAGLLGKARVPEDQALAIVRQLSVDDRKPWDREACVRDTYTKLRAGVEVSGFYRLAGIVPDSALESVNGILSTFRQRNEPRIVLISDHQDRKGASDPVRLFNPSQPPQQAFYGWHGRYLDLVYPTTAAAVAFHLAASTTLEAAMIGRRIATIYAGDRIYPCQYSVVVGPTGGSYKDTAFKRSMQMIEAAQAVEVRNKSLVSAPFGQISDVASREAMIARMSRQPNLYMFASEITTILKNAQRDTTSTLLDALITIWDSPATIQNNSIAAAQEGTNIAHEPTLNLYGGIQPSRMAEQMTETMMTSGLGNRLAIFMGNGRGKLPRTPRLDERGAAELFVELSRAIASYPYGAELEVTDRAGARWDDWFLAIPEEDDETAADMRVRYPVMIQKWGLLFAVTDGAPAIDIQHIDAAISLGDWMWDCVKQLLPTWGTSIERKIEERVLAILAERQPITRRDLSRYAKGKWTSRDVASVLKALSDTGQITFSADKRFVALSDYADRHQMGGVS